MSANLFNILPSSTPRSRLNLDDIREKLAGAKGPRFWRSLDELADGEEFGFFAYPLSCRAPHEGGYAESQVMPSFDLSALCSSSRVTGFHSPSSA
jgi:hypothetical protein